MVKKLFLALLCLCFAHCFVTAAGPDGRKPVLSRQQVIKDILASGEKLKKKLIRLTYEGGALSLLSNVPKFGAWRL
ncbi:MAG: hypothetical protein LBL61_01330 [Elusimicrobiota bacterium]|jgi:hypothetical protein|nr:hypothetical protein [Elusimicrobiota bacterium]